jgi:hypothetical protein
VAFLSEGQSLGRRRSRRIFARVTRGFGCTLIAALGIGGMAQAQSTWEVPAVKGWRDADSLEVHGTINDGVFRPDSIAVPSPPGASTPPLIPLNQNILGSAQLLPFGIEERVKVRRGSRGVAFDCQAGEAPAGLIMHWPDARLPAAYDGQWLLQGSGDAAIGVSLIKRNQDAPAKPAGYWNEDGLSLPFTDPDEHVIVFSCPARSASALIESISLMPAKSHLAARARGTWAWREEEWRSNPQRFARAAHAAGFTQLAVQLPSTPDDKLGQLLSALAQQGVTPRLLDGDPAMATPEGLALAVDRVRRLRSWVLSHANAKGLTLELDIEPYGQAAFAADPEKAWRGWVTAVKRLAAAWGGDVAVDVPWWMQHSTAGTAALGSVSAYVSEFVVMAYRTEPLLILDAVEPWFRLGKSVQVAIETGPVEAEVTRIYRRASRGTLRLKDDAATLLPTAEDAAPGGAIYSLDRQLVTDPSRVSFHDAHDRALEVEREISAILHSWPNFSGFRLHGWSIDGRK